MNDLNIKAYGTNNKSNTTIPYTYSVTHKETGIHYYGSRYSKGCSPDDFFVRYFTSCKIIHDIIKREGIDSFTFKIRKIFTNGIDCINHENKFLARINAKNNPKFFNRQNETIYVNGNFNFITNGSITIKWPKEKKLPKGFNNGRHLNLKSPTKGRIWIHNPITNESRMILKSDIIPEGFILNRPNSVYENQSKILKDKNTICITNGKENRYVNKELPIPKGWHKGKYIKNKENLGKRNYKYKIISNGIEQTHLKEGDILPNGWYYGGIKKPKVPKIRSESFKIGRHYLSKIANIVKTQKEIKDTELIDILGCNSNGLKSYIESLFDNTMNWDNYGIVWYVTYIKPISSFDLTIKDNVYKCFNQKNIKPLNRDENRKKGIATSIKNRKTKKGNRIN